MNFSKTLLIILSLLIIQPSAVTAGNETYDFLTVTVSGNSNTPVPESASGSDNSINGWIYTGLPSIPLAGRSIFTAFEADLIYHTITITGSPALSPMFHRYGLFAGYPLIKTDNISGSLFLGGGFAANVTSFSGNSAYLHLIFDFRKRFTPRFKAGLGILAMNNFGNWILPVSLLPTIKWQPGNDLFVNCNWDNAELIWRGINKTGLVAELRYDRSFFKLDRDFSWYIVSGSFGGGINRVIGKSWEFRLRAFKHIYETSTLYEKSAIVSETRGEKGYSVKAQVAWIR